MRDVCSSCHLTYVRLIPIEKAMKTLDPAPAAVRVPESAADDLVFAYMFNMCVQMDLSKKSYSYKPQFARLWLSEKAINNAVKDNRD